MENKKIKLADGREFNIVKDYLTSTEIQAIIKGVRAERDYINRTNAFDVLLAGALTDIEDFKGDSIDIDKVDEYRRLGVFDEISTYLSPRYYGILIDGIRFEDSVESQLMGIIDYAQAKLDELPKATKGLSTKKIVDSINALGNKMTELAKAGEHLDNTMKN
jgi:hypothetical protein